MKPIYFLFLMGFVFPLQTCFAQQPSRILNEESRNQIITKIGNLLVSNYVENETAIACNQFLIEKMEDNGYEEIAHPREFAKQLNKDLRQIHKDRHVRVQFISPEGRDFELKNPKLFFLLRTQERFKDNLGIRQVKILTGNVGYLDLHSFEPLDLARNKLINTLKILEDVDALIIDLRNNNGGNPNTVQFLCSWFFDKDVHLNDIYWSRGDYTEQFWTLEDIGVKKQPNLPLFILTGSKTFSAAEEFAYNLKVQKRAKLIGLKTAGGANPGYTFSVNDQFNIFIPTGRSINPVTSTNWEGIGVEPDILVTSSNAYSFTHEKAMQAGRVYREKEDSDLIDAYMQLLEDFKTSEELFSTEKIDSAMAILTQSIHTLVNQGNMDEWTINSLGYQYLSDENLAMALALFEYNTSQYPESANAWDSLGEIYYKIGNCELGIKAYHKSLFLNPHNQNARIMIDKLSEHTDE